MIKSKKRLCSICNIESYIFSRGRCKPCSQKSYGSIKKRSEKQKVKIEEKKEILKEDMKFYIRFYNQHPTKRCYECDVKILYPSNINCHHLLGKRFQDKYSIDIRHKLENLVLLCNLHHSQVEIDIDKVPKVKELTKQTSLNFEKYLK